MKVCDACGLPLSRHRITFRRGSRTVSFPDAARGGYDSAVVACDTPMLHLKPRSPYLHRFECPEDGPCICPPWETHDPRPAFPESPTRWTETDFDTVLSRFVLEVVR